MRICHKETDSDIGLSFRSNVQAQRSIWVARLRVLFYSSWALMGFLIRYFIWGSARTERFGSPRRILSSLAWAPAALPSR